MRELWRKAVTLFYSRTLLWLPALCAVVLGVLIGWAGNLAADALLYRIMKTDIDRSGIDPQLFVEVNSRWLHRWAILHATIAGILSFLMVCLLTAGFVATANLVAGAEQDARPDFLAVLRSIRLRMRRVFIFSIKFCLFYLLLKLVMFGIFYRILSGHLTGYRSAHYFNIGIYQATSLIVAYVMTPSALRLVQDSPSHALQAESVRRGRIFTISAVLGLAVIDYGVAAFENALLASRFVPVIERFTINVVGTLLTTLPYSLLFIALALIAESESQEAPTLTARAGN
jgi:hypothetical protein